MAEFVACKGKQFCRDLGDRCVTCGRSHEEITRLRLLIEQLSNLAEDFNYENVTDYSNYIAHRIIKKKGHRKLSET